MKHIFSILALSAALLSCGRLDIGKPKTAKPNDAVVALRDAYASNLSAYNDLTKDRAGWPSVTDCDAAVFAGAACLGGAGVDISLAEYPAGTLNRRPAKACWVPEKAGQAQESSSTASRDDVVLYAACLFRKSNASGLQRLLGYADGHAGYIGLPRDSGTTLLGPNLKTIISRAVAKLTSSGTSGFPVIEAPGVKDYQEHIEAEEILFSTAVSGSASGWELGLLDLLVKEQPANPLFQAAHGVYTGNFDAAISLLLDPATPVPSYVRGDNPDAFARAHWLRAARIVLDRFGDG